MHGSSCVPAVLSTWQRWRYALLSKLETTSSRICRKICGVGPGHSLASMLWLLGGRDSRHTIGLVPCAIGATCIDEWLPHTENFQHMVRKKNSSTQSCRAASKYSNYPSNYTSNLGAALSLSASTSAMAALTLYLSACRDLELQTMGLACRSRGPRQQWQHCQRKPFSRGCYGTRRVFLSCLAHQCKCSVYPGQMRGVRLFLCLQLE